MTNILTRRTFLAGLAGQIEPGLILHRGNIHTMDRTAPRAEAVATFLRENGINAVVGTDGKGASEPIRLPDTSGLTQEDIYALNRRVEWRRD